MIGILKLKVITLAALSTIVCLFISAQHSSGQQSDPGSAGTGGVNVPVGSVVRDSIHVKARADYTPDQATSTSGTPKSGAVSLAGRFSTLTRYVPIRESWGTIDIGARHVKGVIGGLEQGASLGVGIELTTADWIHNVEFRATAITSVKLYRRFLGEVYISKIINENTHADISFDYLRRTKDNFFGIGPDTPQNNRTNFDVERRSYTAVLDHNFTGQLVVGVFFRISNSSTYTGKNTSDPPIDQFFSGDPNTVPVTAWAPGLMTNTKILSYGGFAEYDHRDDSRGLTKGAFFYGRIGSAQGLKYQSVFSDYGWLDGELDGRAYIPLGSDKTSLAVRGYALLRHPRGGSQIPFYDLAYEGGRLYGRGLDSYRYRGNSMGLGSIELRQTIWTQQQDRGLDILGFGDAGQVWGDNRSNTDPAILANQNFKWGRWKSGVGGGLQYRYSKSLAGRIEMGHSSQGNIVYFSVARGF